MPRGAEPGGGNRVSWFKIGLVWAIGAGAAFDPIVFFGDSVGADDDTRTPKEVLEVEWTGGDLMAFVKVVVEGRFLPLMSLEDIPTMVLEIAEFARGSRGKDTGKEDFLGVVTMEVLDLDGNLMDANLIRRDVREVVASGSQGDVTRCGSGFAIGVRDRGVIWLGWTELIDERDSGDRDWDDRGQLCTG